MMLRPAALKQHRNRAQYFPPVEAISAPVQRWIGPSRPSGHRAFTMIELLLVISIMVVLAAIVVPKLRVVTGDRKIREAARVVESMFATARDEAVVNGFSGVEIVRNKNFNNGATSLFRLRQRPPYSGDFQGDGVTIDPGNVLRFWHTNPPASVPPLYGISYVPNPAPELNDYIQFNNRGPLYRMLSANTFEVLPHQPPPPQLTSPPFDYVIPFKIFRKPIRVFSSEVRVPAGTYIDLRCCGESYDDNVLELPRFPDDYPYNPESPIPSGPPNPLVLNVELNDELDSPADYPPVQGISDPVSFVVTFDSHGAIDRLYPRGVRTDPRDDGTRTATQPPAPPYFAAPTMRPKAAIFFLVAIDDEEVAGNRFTSLRNINNLWIAVNGSNGAVKTSDMGANNGTLGPARALATERLNTQQ